MVEQGLAPPPTMVAPHLWVGGLIDAKDFDGITICVHEDPTTAFWSDLHLPFLVEGRADAERLKRIADTVAMFHRSQVNVLLHCGEGSERAPLCAAWVLMQNRLGGKWSLPDAMKHVMTLRPVARDRLEWLH